MAWGGLAVIGFLSGHIDKISHLFNWPYSLAIL
jgi:hypothetical protein